MTIQVTGGASGTLIAAAIQEFIHRLSQELARDARDVQRDARAAELAAGLEAARDLHDKASETRAGACASGAFTLLSAGLEVSAASKVETAAPKADLYLKAAGTTDELGSRIGQLFAAGGTDAEARSAQAQALEKSYGHQADEAGDHMREIQKMDDSAKELSKEIASNEHATMMALLSRR